MQSLSIPTEPIGSILRPLPLIEAMVVEAAQCIALAQLGARDDCRFAPFSDDVSTSRETAFRKIAARVAGTRMASERLSHGAAA